MGACLGNGNVRLLAVGLDTEGLLAVGLHTGRGARFGNDNMRLLAVELDT